VPDVFKNVNTKTKKAAKQKKGCPNEQPFFVFSSPGLTLSILENS